MEMPTHKELVESVLKERGFDVSEKEIHDAIWERNQVSVKGGTIRQIKSNFRAIQKKPNDNLSSSVSNSSGNMGDTGSVLETSANNGDRNALSSNLASSDDNSNLASLETERSEKLDTGKLTITLEKSETPPEAGAMAEQYRKKTEAIDNKVNPEKIKSAELEKIELDEERIDAELMADNSIDLVDMVATSKGEALSKKEREKGQKVIGRIIKRRLPVLSQYGDIVNFGLWLFQVLPKRIFRIRPKVITPEETKDMPVLESFGNEETPEEGKQNENS